MGGWCLCPGRGGGGGRWKGKWGTGELSGEGVVPASPCGDQGPQGRVGSKDPVVSMAVDAGWREDLGEAIQELESRETQGGAAGQVGPREQVEDLVGAVVDEMKAVESEGPPGAIPSQGSGAGFWEVYPGLGARLAAVPGVRSVSGVSSFPFHGFPEDAFLDIPGREVREGEERTTADRRQVLPGYFETLGIALLEGRTLEPSDAVGATPVVVVSEALARRLWPGAPAIGQSVGFSGTMYTVVGVVGDVRHRSLSEEGNPTFYLSYQQYRQGSLTLVVRADSDPRSLLPSLRAAVWEITPTAVLGESLPVSDLLARTTGGERFRAVLLAVFALSALLLAMAGVLGVAAREVARRTRELGIRKALGARDGELVGTVVGATLRGGALGMALGGVGALLATRLLTSYLFGVQPLDPWTFGGALLLLGILSLASAFVPARRAARIEAMQALRSQ